MKALLIDDEFSTLRHLKNHLEQKKWLADTADTYEKALKKILTKEYDVIVCDYYLSEDENEKHGLELITEVRSEGVTTPVIFLTGRKIHEVTPWAALNSGCDDFMNKPWKPQELIARIEAVVRRSFACAQNATNLLKQGPLTLDIDLKRVFVGDTEIHLGNILFLLLKKFIQKPNVLISYDDLINYIWETEGAAAPEQKNTLRVHITHLKKALGKKYAKALQTIHGEGYVWNVPEAKDGERESETGITN